MVPHAQTNVVIQNLLVSTSRKEISWCNKARLRGASTSRVRAKVWAQLARAWGPGLTENLGGVRAWAGASRGLGPGPTGAWGN